MSGDAMAVLAVTVAVAAFVQGTSLAASWQMEGPPSATAW